MDESEQHGEAAGGRLLSVEGQVCPRPAHARELASQTAQLAAFGRWLSAAGRLAVGEQVRFRAGATLQTHEPPPRTGGGPVGDVVRAPR